MSPQWCAAIGTLQGSGEEAQALWHASCMRRDFSKKASLQLVSLSLIRQGPV